MTLSDLADYAVVTHHMEEQHKWQHFPGFSVLSHPRTGKWVALLMRQKDQQSGRKLEFCDIRVGKYTENEIESKRYLGPPKRMVGKRWLGVDFQKNPDRAVVIDMLNRAVKTANEEARTIVLDNDSQPDEKNAYRDTQLTFNSNGIRSSAPRRPGTSARTIAEEHIPEQIQKMLSLYKFAEMHVGRDALNFYRQAEFMMDYEDDTDWTRINERYYPLLPTYHSLNLPLLRGYFSWRKYVRMGDVRDAPLGYAHLYAFELLGGFGASSPEDALIKLKDFEERFLRVYTAETRTPLYVADSKEYLRSNLRLWSHDYAIINGLPRETVLEYENRETAAQDNALEALLDPGKHTDEEIFSALARFSGKRISGSAFVKKNGEEAVHLFSGFWRFLTEHYPTVAKQVFQASFGKCTYRKWTPMYDAVYWPRNKVEEHDYVLNACRTYRYRNDEWRVGCYRPSEHRPDKLHQLMRGADRVFRQYKKTGSRLQETEYDKWVTRYVDEFLAEDRRAAEEAARQEIDIDFSELKQIRKEASVTRDSLLTEEELGTDELVIAQTISPGLESTNAASSPEAAESGAVPALDDVHMQILELLLKDESVDRIIESNHLMPTVVMDTINEALFDDIGDNALEYDGSSLSVVEDYKDDVAKALGGVTV